VGESWRWSQQTEAHAVIRDADGVKIADAWGAEPVTRLIADAPELLKALQQLLQAGSNDDAIGDPVCHYCRAGMREDWDDGFRHVADCAYVAASDLLRRLSLSPSSPPPSRLAPASPGAGSA
jgi:hypothetical protein